MNTFNISTNLRAMNIANRNQPPQQIQKDGVSAPNLIKIPNAPNEINFIEAHPLLQEKQLVELQQGMPTTSGTSPSSVPIYGHHQPQLINELQKSYYPNLRASFDKTNATSERYFTTAPIPETSATHTTATVLFTNPFTTHPHALLQNHQEHHGQQEQNTIAGNIKIAPSALTELSQLEQSEIVNASRDIDKDLVNDQILRLQQQQIYEEQDPQLLHHFGDEQQISLLSIPPATNPHYYQGAHYVHSQPIQQFYTTTTASKSAADTSSSSLSNASLLNNVSNVSNPFSQIATSSNTTSSINSTVLLDRINICINNHYNEVGPITTPVAISTSISTTPPQQPSPIIPAIQYKAVVDSPQAIVLTPASSEDRRTIVIDEPDSTTTTTTPHTPPTTPQKTPEAIYSASGTAKSLTTMQISSNKSVNMVLFDETKSIKKPKVIKNDSIEDGNVSYQVLIEDIPEEIHRKPQQMSTGNNNVKEKSCMATPLPSSSPTPPPLSPPAMKRSFSIGEDVLIKRSDDRFYLGKITDSGYQQFLVRFDDNSEFWASLDKMHKLSSVEGKHKGQMCVACKRSEDLDVVEICERCGRGYHRKCTQETVAGSGNWWCNRCAKPMKIIKTSARLDQLAHSPVLQLPYDINLLNWDEKHRINEEQIYCYCSKSGKFDEDMIQCCRCKNWYHKECIAHGSEIIMLRGDNFFVFCCSVCNKGLEFLRRVQMNWVDLVQLILYNLSAKKAHVHQKYHHLIKDIWPFALKSRPNLPIPKTWIEGTEEQFCEKIKRTLNANTERFICGKEMKRDPLYYALRSNEPPASPRINVGPNDVLSDVFLTKSLNLTLLKEFPGNIVEQNVCSTDLKEYSFSRINKKKQQAEVAVHDVYEFRIEDDEKFTSDDEIPIKHIIEKAKKSKGQRQSNQNKSSTVERIDMEDSNDESDKSSSRNYEKLSTKPVVNSNENKKKDTKLEVPKHNSRKRKAFVHFKNYKESLTEGGDTRICDSSSDENSSSSRGTSLDLIIPPPKNFLGLNNPFRVVSPKKNSVTCNVGGDKKGVKKGNKKSFSTTAHLDFSAKLAALKSSGILSNLNSCGLVKAAGQPRLVRTIKRRLSAKDITIGPNQEVRRRRIRRLSSNVEVISETTINSFPSNYIPIHAKDINSSNQKTCSTSSQNATSTNYLISSNNSSASSCSVEYGSMKASSAAQSQKPQHGRHLRQRPEKYSPDTSRRNSTSGASNSSNSSALSAGAAVTSHTCGAIQDLKQSVTKYFGAINRIESGEKFFIRAKRKLANGQMQYLIEWGDEVRTN